MRKPFVTLPAISLLGGLFLSGTMPVAMSMAAPTAIQDLSQGAEPDGRPADCDHGETERKGGHAGLSCCISGHCPMLGQGLPVVAEFRPFAMTGPLLRPAPYRLEAGIAAGPDLRPPRPAA